MARNEEMYQEAPAAASLVDASESAAKCDRNNRVIIMMGMEAWQKKIKRSNKG